MFGKFKVMAVAAAPFLLVACGSSDENYLVEACIKDGQSESVCECTADIMTEALSPDQIEMMATMSKLQADDGLTEQEAQAKMMEEYNMMELMALGMATIEPAMRASQECN